MRKRKEIQEVSRNGRVRSVFSERLTPWARFWLFFLRLLYDLVFLLVLLFCAPYFLFRMLTTSRFRAGIFQRLGFVPARQFGRPCLWVHGVSVGETKAAKPLVDLIQNRNKDLEVVVSSTTEEGHALARELFPNALCIYYPLDFSLIVAKVFSRMRPMAVVLMELEIWPNFLLTAKKKNIPVFVANGRLSEKSFRGYVSLRRFLPQFPWVDLYSVQTENYAERFRRLGVPVERIQVTGNLKFDGISAVDKFATDSALAWIEHKAQEYVLVAGSTHEGEEVELFQMVSQLNAQGFGPIRLILAPRHPTRVDSVIQELRNLGANPLRLTVARQQGKLDLAPVCLVIDTIGDLEKFYAFADFVFVGGSLIPRGGHNFLEPAAQGKAILVGPHTFNFAAEISQFLMANALLQAEDSKQLKNQFAMLLQNPKEAAAMGKRAAAVVQANRGATLRTVQAIETRLLPMAEKVSSPN